jgi:hypothetical protein
VLIKIVEAMSKAPSYFSNYEGRSSYWDPIQLRAMFGNITFLVAQSFVVTYEVKSSILFCVTIQVCLLGHH